LNRASWVVKSMRRGNNGIDHRGSGKRREGLSTNKEARLCDLHVGSFRQRSHLISLPYNHNPQALMAQGLGAPLIRYIIL
jgi:hypothetical protein